MASLTLDRRALADLTEFAHLEWTSHDLEPWAEMIDALLILGTLDTEQALWVTKLYNSYDDFGSAWSVYDRWDSPRAWAMAADADDVRRYPIMQERRNLLGGRIIKHFGSYVTHLGTSTQCGWIASALAQGVAPEANWTAMLAHTRQVWGVGRQASFEWTEFVAKVFFPADLDAPDACLWESSGPRESLERLYGNPNPDRAWLDEAAWTCRAMLHEAGIPLPWVDFETVICDFNVMRKGRYYPGKHLAALREEIDTAPSGARSDLHAAWERVVPAPWVDIAPGVDKSLLSVYRDTGRMPRP